MIFLPNSSDAYPQNSGSLGSPILNIDAVDTVLSAGISVRESTFFLEILLSSSAFAVGGLVDENKRKEEGKNKRHVSYKLILYL